MTTIKSKNKPGSRTVSIPFNDIATEVTLFAKRGAVLYGFCTTPRHSVALVELIETAPGIFYLRDTKSITIQDQTSTCLNNNVRVTVRCFICNAYLDEDFPDLIDAVVSRMLEMIAAVPKPEVYAF